MMFNALNNKTSKLCLPIFVLIGSLVWHIASSAIAQSAHSQFKTHDHFYPTVTSTHRLTSSDLVPVQVIVSGDKTGTGWTYAFHLCNNSAYPIPLKHIQFTFHNLPADIAREAMPIWGQPYLDWRVTSNNNDEIILTGGNEWTPDLQPDPQCTHMLNIIFGYKPTLPNPTGPFEFQAVGGHPIGNGTIAITMPTNPATGLPNPKVKVTGMGTSVEQTVSWSHSWQLMKLIPGAYDITASPVDNGTQFFRQTAPIHLIVKDQNTAVANIQYMNVPASSVNITLHNAPNNTNQIIDFIGQHYAFHPTITGHSGALLLPNDTYTVTAALAGYTISASPNPLSIPGNTSLTLTYQPAVEADLPHFVGYFQSWSSTWATDGEKTELANLPAYVNIIPLAFMRPDAEYVKSSLDYTATGLQFNYANGTVLKQAIAALHKKHPNTKILVAVGGAAYTNWAKFNAKAIADFVVDFGCDGVDIDFEPTYPGCSLDTDGLIHCAIDAELQSYISSMRALLPKPRLLTSSAWSIGAYGENQWTQSQPQGQYTGVMLPLLRSAAAKDLDMLNVMAYDAGNTYDPQEALAAYAHYFSGPINMGIEVPPEAWGGHVYTLSKINRLTSAVVALAATRHVPPGMMLWSLQKQIQGTPSSDNPSGSMIATAICTGLSLEHCADPINK